MTDFKPTSSAAPAAGPIAEELAQWLSDIRSAWTGSLPYPLLPGLRKFYAFAGSFTWLVGFVLVLSARDPRFLNFIFGNLVYISCVFVLLVLFSLWFGWLVAFTKRKCGPIRLFLDGLLLPAATVSIIGFSAERVLLIPTEPAQSPVRLEPETELQASTQPSSVTLEAETEEANSELPELTGEPEAEERPVGSEPPN